MNRREFLRRSALAALMATPAMQAAALLRDFGFPANVGAIGEMVTLASGETVNRVGFLTIDMLISGSSPCINLDHPSELLSMEDAVMEKLTVRHGPITIKTTSDEFIIFQSE